MIRLLCFLSLPWLVVPVHAQEASDQFRDATILLNNQSYQKAAESFLLFAEQHPNHSNAADALFTSARLYEEQLQNPVRATQLYRQLLQRYPNDRTSLATQRRLQLLQQMLGPSNKGAEPLAQFQVLRQQRSTLGLPAVVAAAENLLQTSPDWPGSIEVHVWLAESYHQLGQFDRAIARYLHAAQLRPQHRGCVSRLCRRGGNCHTAKAV